MPQKILLLLFILTHPGFSQGQTQPSTPSMAQPSSHTLPSFHTLPLPGDAGETLALETDRSFYCIDEKIHFRASYDRTIPLEGVPWSTVVYVELIRWNGEQMAQGKFKLHERHASGYLNIPHALLSGTYYLRAYTRWMRNFPAEAYAYQPVKIINPYESNIDQGPPVSMDQGPPEPVNQAPPEPVNQATLEPVDQAHSRVRSLRGGSSRSLECVTDKSSYGPREKVELTVRLSGPPEAAPDFCLSVAKTAYLDTAAILLEFPDQGPAADASLAFLPDSSLAFLPETRGISISGKIVTDQAPASAGHARMHLATPQNGKYFTSFQTGNEGFFYFSLPNLYGSSDFYLDAVLENGERAEILIDNDYCKRPVQLGYVPFSLDAVEEKTALEMLVNMQLSTMYGDEQGGPAADSAHQPFYIRPDRVYDTREYIQLPNLEEFFFFLFKEVRTVRSADRTQLKMARFSAYSDLMPLVLIDHVPVPDVDELLKTPLDRIEEVHILDQPYMVSGVNYSGIIGVTTRRKDFAGIDLHQNSLFFSYDLLSDEHAQIRPPRSSTGEKLTYRRNLLFWEPHIEWKDDQSQSFSFYTSDSKGEYVVYIRSAGSGDAVRRFGSCTFVVE